MTCFFLAVRQSAEESWRPEGDDGGIWSRASMEIAIGETNNHNGLGIWPMAITIEWKRWSNWKSLELSFPSCVGACPVFNNGKEQPLPLLNFWLIFLARHQDGRSSLAASDHELILVPSRSSSLLLLCRQFHCLWRSRIGGGGDPCSDESTPGLLHFEKWVLGVKRLRES